MKTDLKSAKGILSTFFVLFLAVTVNAQENFGGLALYTVRDNMGDDAKATLEKVEEAGYAYVEAAGYSDGKYYGMAPEDFKAYLNSLGLQPVSTHQASATLDNIDTELAAAKKAGFEYFVIPVPPMGLFTYNSETKSMGMKGSVSNLAEILTQMGKKCEAVGLKLLYHNHDFEYKRNEEGIVPIDYLLEHTDPKYVNFQMDLYWVTKAGADPLAYFEKYPGRFKAWHVKDMDEEGKFAPVGEGTIDFKRILAQKEASGMVKYFVEQDRTWDQKPMEVIKISHEGLKEIGFH
ncbi:sugar phosphate isomerase/epimerase family protein [Flagellimonas olearia]|uniref:Sugar phosphate isomerase n=1 Tax=Flagellimonas olearia TaxID=552546 RepID=A0A444VHV5_9FLAO|nr:sugar phosphate isomerase/epimerase [Allomuricauda olearia]RYC50348.1 sugar phosphate isomerase [Allomuricauda olearia]